MSAVSAFVGLGANLGDARATVEAALQALGVGKGDTVYVRGDLNGATVFQVYQPSQPLRDPDTRASP